MQAGLLTVLHHRLCTLLIAQMVLAAAASTGLHAGPDDEGRIAIIHASQSTIIHDDLRPRPEVLQGLYEAGVRVIGRYLARCRQKGFPTKPLVHGGGRKQDDAAAKHAEADAILQKGFGIISIYQYKSGGEDGELGRIKFTRGHGREDGTQCESTRAFAESRVSRSPRDEGRLDAQAAIMQAGAIRQPAGTAIYFGVDFDFDATNRSQRNGLLAYFREIRDELKRSRNGYLVGAYGNGDALELLMPTDPKAERLIDIAWLSASPSFRGTSKFYNSRRWALAQTQSDNKVVFVGNAGCIDFEHDTDVQNPAVEYTGAWDRSKSGRFYIPKSRTEAVFSGRRFVCNAEGIIPGWKRTSCEGRNEPIKCCDGQRELKRCLKEGNVLCLTRFVRIETPPVSPTDIISIDYFDRGKFERPAPATSLSHSLSIKPFWEAGERNAKPCTCFGSDERIPCPN
jgi:Domain of unknown function (DUF1906)